MKIRILLVSVAPLFALPVMPVIAAPPKAVRLDFSSQALIDSATAKAVLDEGIPADAWKGYPATKWGFVRQVEGGMTAAGVCIVTARVMMVPLIQAVKAALFRPEKIATAFDGASGMTAEQCRASAETEFVEATQSIVSSFVKP